VALGLTNLLIRRLASKGYVKVSRIRRRQVQYLLTPAGFAEKARVSRLYFENTLRLYTESRERIRHRLEELSRAWPQAAPPGGKRVVFYGGGEVAEIAFVSLSATDLHLIGVIDDDPQKQFFGLPVVPVTRVRPGFVDSEPFDRIVITSLRHADTLAAKLRARGINDAFVYAL
jgi:hypothetical protein